MHDESKPRPEQLLLGVFIGGQSSRMGTPKGLLRAPLEDVPGLPHATLVERLLHVGEQGLGLTTVLVGERAEYASLGRTMVADQVTDCGPLGGLCAVLRWAADHGKQFVLAWACDLPWVSLALARRLAFFDRSVGAVCPRRGELYEPLFARYDVACLGVMQQALASGRYGLQPVLRTLGATSLPVDAAEVLQLTDWDHPGDIRREPT